MKNHSLDPFKIFGIPYSFDVENLDFIYFKKYKKNQNLEELNLAYRILKDPLQKLLFLCNYYGKNISNSNIVVSIFYTIKTKNKKEIINLLNRSFFDAIEFARKKCWDSCWQEVQKYQYLKKITFQDNNHV